MKITIKLSMEQLNTIKSALDNDIFEKEQFFEGFEKRTDKKKYSHTYNHYIKCKKLLKELLEIYDFSKVIELNDYYVKKEIV